MLTTQHRQHPPKPPLRKQSRRTSSQTETLLNKKTPEMQQSIDKLKADIQTIQTTRNELQAKLDQSDKDVAAQNEKKSKRSTPKSQRNKKLLTHKRQKKQWGSLIADQREQTGQHCALSAQQARSRNCACCWNRTTPAPSPATSNTTITWLPLASKNGGVSRCYSTYRCHRKELANSIQELQVLQQTSSRKICNRKPNAMPEKPLITNSEQDLKNKHGELGKL
ncbi:MAG: hypothetical protein IPK30_12155 [Cellvibrionales bacterium]|nr:hypothetical protein [Cellvibrionales bacterium]